MLKFKRPQIPEGKQLGFLFNIASGKQLDNYGEWSNLPRKKWLFIKEPDFSYKNRLIQLALEEGK